MMLVHSSTLSSFSYPDCSTSESVSDPAEELLLIFFDFPDLVPALDDDDHHPLSDRLARRARSADNRRDLMIFITNEFRERIPGRLVVTTEAANLYYSFSNVDDLLACTT